MAPGKILFLSKGEQSASTRYRALAYFPYLIKAGWQPTHRSLRGGLLSKIEVLFQARSSDVVVLLRHTLTFPYLNLLRYFAKVLIFDYDDAVFVRSNGQPSKTRGNRFQATLKKCDQVWAGNQYLADKARELVSNVIYLPTVVDMEHYNQSASVDAEFIDLVWIGSTSTSRYIKKLLPVLEQAARNNSRLRLVLVSDFSLPSEVLPIKTVAWNEEAEVTALKSADIGIAPMWDDAWTRGKCALKVLQYMASGKPVISSSVGANNEVVVDGETGLLVNADIEWLEAIERLADSDALRLEMGQTGYARCQKYYSVEVCAQCILKQLANL